MFPKEKAIHALTDTKGDMAQAILSLTTIKRIVTFITRTKSII